MQNSIRCTVSKTLYKITNKSHRMRSLSGQIPGLFVPLHFRSRERKDHQSIRKGLEFTVTKVLRDHYKRTIERTFAPVELSFYGTFAPWNFRSSGAKVPRTFVPTNEYFKNFRSKCPKTRPITLQ